MTTCEKCGRTKARAERSLGDPRAWGNWLSAEQAMARYDISRSSLERLKAFVAWSNQPGTGLRFYAPDIETYIEAGRQIPAGLKVTLFR